jgi:hypothetical protein
MKQSVGPQGDSQAACHSLRQNSPLGERRRFTRAESVR